ncbi:hypothetical protein LguiA_025497 [Lonicera macranthoides]
MDILIHIDREKLRKFPKLSEFNTLHNSTHFCPRSIAAFMYALLLSFGIAWWTFWISSFSPSNNLEVEFLALLIGQPHGRDGVGRAPLVQMMNGEVSLQRTVWVFLFIPSVHIPLAPSMCVNDDDDASLRRTVLVFLLKPIMHIPLAPSAYTLCKNLHQGWLGDYGFEGIGYV